MKTKNMMVGILAGVLVLALWWTMLLKPARSKASKVRADTAVQQSKLDPLEAQLAQAQRDAANAATMKTQLEDLQRAMPNSPALAAFIRNANDIAEASGVSWQSVTHGPPTVGLDGTTSITLGIQVKGTYPQVQDYQTRLAPRCSGSSSSTACSCRPRRRRVRARGPTPAVRRPARSRAAPSSRP